MIILNQYLTRSCTTAIIGLHIVYRFNLRTKREKRYLLRIAIEDHLRCLVMNTVIGLQLHHVCIEEEILVSCTSLQLPIQFKIKTIQIFESFSNCEIKHTYKILRHSNFDEEMSQMKLDHLFIIVTLGANVSQSLSIYPNCRQFYFPIYYLILLETQGEKQHLPVR